MAETDPNKIKETTSAEHINAEKNFTPNEYEDYGYFFYHDRLNLKHYIPWHKRFLTFAGSRENIRKLQCESNVKSCIEKR
jgi:hypothetical protein